MDIWIGKTKQCLPKGTSQRARAGIGDGIQSAVGIGIGDLVGNGAAAAGDRLGGFREGDRGQHGKRHGRNEDKTEQSSFHAAIRHLSILLVI